MLYTFSAADPVVKSRLLQSYCLSLYGCSLWDLSCASIHSIEVSFNNILRRIWHLPRNYHTNILHLTARLPSLFNVVSSRSLSLLSSALSCPSLVVRKVFRDSRFLAYTHTGYNSICGNLHTKKYYHEDGLCATVIRHLRTAGTHTDPDINDMIYVISTS